LQTQARAGETVYKGVFDGLRKISVEEGAKGKQAMFLEVVCSFQLCSKVVSPESSDLLHNSLRHSPSTKCSTNTSLTLMPRPLPPPPYNKYDQLCRRPISREYVPETLCVFSWTVQVVSAWSIKMPRARVSKRCRRSSGHREDRGGGRDIRQKELRAAGMHSELLSASEELMC
jgi:hypothetical protein